MRLPVHPKSQLNPVWLCIWEKPFRIRWVRGPLEAMSRKTGDLDPRKAKLAQDVVARRCVRNGWGRPSSMRYGGFSARDQVLPEELRRRAAGKPRLRSAQALRMYAALRSSWPVRSHLSDPMTRPASQRQLMDFVANVGVAIEALRATVVDDEEPEVRQARYRAVMDALGAQEAAWLSAATVLNLQRAVAGMRAMEDRAAADRSDLELDRRRKKRMNYQQALDLARSRKTEAQREGRKLRRRKAYLDGCAELDAILDGALPEAEDVAVGFRDWLIASGWNPEDAARVSVAWSRVPVPRL